MTNPHEIVGIAMTNGLTLWLTRGELGEAGYRRTVRPDGVIVGQFALSRRYGEFVYPEFRGSVESAQDVIARTRRDRARMEGQR